MNESTLPSIECSNREFSSSENCKSEIILAVIKPFVIVEWWRRHTTEEKNSSTDYRIIRNENENEITEQIFANNGYDWKKKKLMHKQTHDSNTHRVRPHQQIE